jgi:hypothetical protein
MSNRYENHLHSASRAFYIVAALLLATGIALVSQIRNRRVLEKTLEEVTHAQSGLGRVKEAATNRRQTLTALKSQLDTNVKLNSPEMVLYRKFDVLKAQLNADDMTMVSLEKKGEEASLQFYIVFNNPDFNSLLNTVSRIHTGTFPLTPISAISISQSDGKGTNGLTYKITGRIITGNKVNP